MNKNITGYKKYRWIVPALVLVLELGLLIFVATGGNFLPLFDSPAHVIGSCLAILWIVISIGVKIHSIFVPEHQIARAIIVFAAWTIMIMYFMISHSSFPVMADSYSLIRGLVFIFMPYLDNFACL